MACLFSTNLLKKVDLPTLGLPTIATMFAKDVRIYKGAKLVNKFIALPNNSKAYLKVHCLTVFHGFLVH